MKLVVFLLALVCAQVFGNGGGYHYGTDFTGGIAPFTSVGTEQVAILDELLDVRLGQDEAKVTVRYKMKNEGEKKAVVKFGFPVEEVTSNWDGGFEREDKKVYCKNYTILLNGEPIRSKYMAEPFKKGLVKKFKGSEVLEGIEGWMVSEMKLKPGVEVVVEIRYDSVYDLESYSISDDFSEGPWLFRYRFSSGAVWKGPIKKGKVVIHFGNMKVNGVKAVKPVNRYKREGKTLVWEFKDLEPTLKDDLELQVRPQNAEYGYYGEEETDVWNYVLTENNWYLKHVKYKVVASSVLAAQGKHTYEAGNLKKRWKEVWSEGVKGSGVGEKLVFTLGKPMVLDAVDVMAGYYNGEDEKGLFKANNRVKSAILTFNGKTKKVIHFEDKNEIQRIWLGYDKPIKTLTFELAEVYRGTKFDDTCIAELSMLTKLKQKPKTYGAR